MRAVLQAILFILLVAPAQAQPVFPPVRPDPVPPFQVPRPGSGALDDGWQYMQTIADADTAFPLLLNAYPVQMAFTHEGRGFLATLHTVFHTSNAGRTWRNLDPSPPPANGSPWDALRTPAYVSGIAARPLVRTQASPESLLVSTFNSTSNIGRVRLLSFAVGNYFLQQDTITFHIAPHWQTGIVLPDSDRAYAFAGYDRKIYWRDSLSTPVLVRWDSIYATQSAQWVAGPVARANRLLMAVGGEQWVSRDAGFTWAPQPAADPQGDYGVSFADSLHGLTGGGRLNPSSGWVHRTTDGGLTWSGRVLETSVPVRCVEMVTPEIGFAAGGNYNTATGEIWKTTDGGLTWALDAAMNAEITAIESRRTSGAYVTVVAAGAFPDFRGGVWRNQLYLPEANSAALVIDPDTLDFGVVARGDTGHAATGVHNFGSAYGLIYTVAGSGTRFAVTDPPANVQIAPGADLPLQLIFTPPVGDTLTEYTATLVLLSADGQTDIFVRGAVPVAAGGPGGVVPRDVTLAVWPNPGNAEFRIRFAVDRDTDVTLRVFDVAGRIAAQPVRGFRTAGEHSFSWSPADLPSGVYFVRLDAAGLQRTQKLLLIR